MKINVGIIKVEISMPEAVKALEEFRLDPKRTFDLISHELRSAVSNLFDQPFPLIFYFGPGHF